MSADRILVTGGAGFIGSHLVDRLVQQGHPVTVLDDLSTGSIENLREATARGDVRVVAESILDEHAAQSAMVGCDTVYHLAVQSVRRSLGKPMENHAVNATGTLKVLEAARRARIALFVYCSSSEVYGNCSDAVLEEESTVCQPTTVYGAAKLAGEHYTLAYHRAYGLPAIVVRPFNSYGPREHDQGDLAEVIPRFVIRIMNGLPPVIFGDGSNGRDFTYVTDTARGLASVAREPDLVGKVVNIASGRLVTIAEVAHAVGVVCGRPELLPVRAAPRPGDVHRLQADTRRAHTTLGFRPEVDFEDGLRAYVNWFNVTYPDPSGLLERDVQNWHMPT
jgi:UDP-glucose 4-epimerase